MQLAPKKTRLLRWTLAAVLAILAVYAIVAAARLWLAYDNMRDSRDLLLSAESLLRREGLDASPATLTEAEARALAAREGFRSARDLLDDEPLLVVAESVPLIGHQVSAASGLASIGYLGSETSLDGIASLRAFNTVSVEGKGTPGEKLRLYLEAIEPPMEAAEQRLAAIRMVRNRIDTTWTLPPLSAFVEQLDLRLARAEESLQRYHDGRAVADHVLGFDRRTSYLMLGMDNTEILPGGGLVGTYGVVTFEDGRIAQRSFSEIADLHRSWQARSGGEHIEPPGPLARYLLRGWSWKLALSTWSPDFPTSARQALFFYDRSGADPVDGVIALDFAGLEGLLSVVGPTDVPGYGVTVDSANATEETLAHIGKPLRPEDGEHAFARAVATQVVDSVLVADRDKWLPLLETLDRLTREKHLFLYVNDSRVQSSVSELGWAGRVKDGPGDYLMAAEASVRSSKLNLVVEHEMEMRIELDEAGAADNRLVLKYRNDLTQWAAQGRDPDLMIHMLNGFYGGYVRLLTPPQTQVRDVTLDQRPAGAEEIGSEAGKLSFGRYLPLPRDSRVALAFTYTVPNVVDTSGSTNEYRLLVQKQPGTFATPLRLEVALPPAAEVESVSLDGQNLPGDPLLIRTQLSVDRELVVRYAS